MTVVDHAKLRIKDQSALINAIAGTYKDLYRACMEYIDNAVDAACVVTSGGKPSVRIDVLVDVTRREIIIRDNAGGMSPKELKNLLESIGESSKKAVPWANGQFGFGVHAFRAFGSEVQFTSRTRGGVPHRLTINRALTEHDSVPLHELPIDDMAQGVTEVRIGQFDKGVFRKHSAVERLRAEIELHFQDVLAASGVEIRVGRLGDPTEACQPFDHSALPGIEFRRDLFLGGDGSQQPIRIDMKLLEEVARGQCVRVTAKRRRIAALSDLASFRGHCRKAQRDVSVWHDPCLVGVVELGEAIQPNLTRDDLKQTNATFELYEALMEFQAEIENVITERRHKKRSRNKSHVGDMVSSYLAKYMRGFKFAAELSVGTGVAAAVSGGSEPGGGGQGPDIPEGEGSRGTDGRGGMGDDDVGGGRGPARKPGDGATAAAGKRTPTAPSIRFDDYKGGERSFLRGYDIVVNTAHDDYYARNSTRDAVVMNERMLSYIATVISPLCVVAMAEKKGLYMTPLEVGMEVAGFSLGLEAFLQQHVGELKHG